MGGDFYDVFDLPNNRIGLFIADVADKGVPAALFMGATFPVLVRVLVTDKDRIGSQLGGFYALNTVGTVIGGVAAPFFFIPRIGTSASVMVGVGGFSSSTLRPAPGKTTVPFASFREEHLLPEIVRVHLGRYIGSPKMWCRRRFPAATLTIAGRSC